MVAGYPSRRVGLPVDDWVFLAIWAIGTVIAICAAVVTPPFINPDEGAHYLRSNEVAHGRWLNAPGQVGIEMPCEEYHTVASKYFPLAYCQPLGDEAARASPECRANSRNTVGFYSPLPYLASAVGMRFAEIAGASPEEKMVAGRVANALATSLIGVVALWAIRKHRAALALLMLMPETLWLRAALSADAMTITLTVGFLAYVIFLAERMKPLGRREFAMLALLGALMGLTKVVYGLVCFSAVVLFPLYRDAGVRRIAGLVGLLLPGVIAIGVAAVWMHQVAPDLVYIGSGASPEAQLQHIWADPARFVLTLGNTIYRHGDHQLYNFFIPSVWVPVPTGEFLAVMLGLACIGTAIGTSPVLPLRGRIFLFGLTIVGAVAVMIPAYLTYTPVGFREVVGVQGRYFIPMACLLAVSLASSRHFSAAMPRAESIRGLFGMGLPVAIDAYLTYRFLL